MKDRVVHYGWETEAGSLLCLTLVFMHHAAKTLISCGPPCDKLLNDVKCTKYSGLFGQQGVKGETIMGWYL